MLPSIASDAGLAGPSELAGAKLDALARPPFAAAAQFTLTVPVGGGGGGGGGGTVEVLVVNENPDATAALPAASFETTWK